MTSAVRHLTEAGFLGKFYIDGEWRKPAGSATAVVVNPATEQPIAEVALGNDEDVERAVAAAGRAFAGWSCKPAAERAALLDRIHGLILERLGTVRAGTHERDGGRYHLCAPRPGAARRRTYPRRA